MSRGLAVLDFCESKYKEAESKASELALKADKWKHYARAVYRVVHPRFLDSALAFATASRANHQLATLFEDALAKLVETRLIGEQIFVRYRLTLKDKDALASAVEGLVREKEAMSVRTSDAMKRVLELEGRVRELERRR